VGFWEEVVEGGSLDGREGKQGTERVEQFEFERFTLFVKGYWVVIINEKELGQSCSTHAWKAICLHMHKEENNIKMDGTEVEREPVDIVHLFHNVE